MKQRKNNIYKNSDEPTNCALGQLITVLTVACKTNSNIIKHAGFSHAKQFVLHMHIKYRNFDKTV